MPHVPEKPAHLVDLRDEWGDPSPAAVLRADWAIAFARENRPRPRGTVRCRHDGALVGEVRDFGRAVVLGVGKPLRRLYLVDSSDEDDDMAYLAADPVEHGLCADHPDEDGSAQMAEIALRALGPGGPTFTVKI